MSPTTKAGKYTKPWDRPDFTDTAPGQQTPYSVYHCHSLVSQVNCVNFMLQCLKTMNKQYMFIFPLMQCSSSFLAPGTSSWKTIFHRLGSSGEQGAVSPVPGPAAEDHSTKEWFPWGQRPCLFAQYSRPRGPAQHLAWNRLQEIPASLINSLLLSDSLPVWPI